MGHHFRNERLLFTCILSQFGVICGRVRGGAYSVGAPRGERCQFENRLQPATLWRMTPATQTAIAQLDDLINQWENTPNKTDGIVSWKTDGVLLVRLKEAIRRLSPAGSTYDKSAEKQVELLKVGHVAKALRADYANGYLAGIGEIIHAEVFSDFLEAAGHLLGAGYKDAAAVMIGGVLETHLRQLCVKHNVLTEQPNAKGIVEPKKAENLNVDLRQAGAYDANVQKQVTAMLAIRNSAAHAKYDEYDKARIDLFLAEVRHFLAAFPA